MFMSYVSSLMHYDIAPKRYKIYLASELPQELKELSQELEYISCELGELFQDSIHIVFTHLLLVSGLLRLGFYSPFLPFGVTCLSILG